ncbi:MAG TPA: GDSL-type esterase/lipase family protein [Candidatus Hydrogenedentes bacterium]|nr:GDSL-type esterase/lipase family protein [Candidatus Hydrogenedentota bacterium]HPG67768.1 GDSL-type esterase/lipase family protein [Candidatus Hydrogenedentota bacterium]
MNCPLSQEDKAQPGAQGRRGCSARSASPVGRMAVAVLALAAVVLAVVVAVHFAGRGIRSPKFDLTLFTEDDGPLVRRNKANLDGVRVDNEFEGVPVTFRVSTNAEGLRNGPLVNDRPRCRVLAIGDSTTFGLCVEDDQAWPNRLEVTLDDDGPALYEVLNAGVVRYSSFQGLRYLQTRGEALRPDVVIASFGPNDQTLLGDTDFPDPMHSRGLTPLAVVFRRLLRGEEDPQRPPREKSPRLSPGEFLDNLIHIADWCREREVFLVLMAWPLEAEWREDPLAPPSYRSLVHEAGSRTGTPVIDVLDAREGVDAPMYVDTIHMNAEGCLLVANLVAQRLPELLPEQLRVRVADRACAHAESCAATADVETVVAACRWAITWFPTRAESYARVDAALDQLDMPNVRIRFWQDAAKAHSAVPWGPYFLGMALNGAGRPAEAADAFRTAADLRPEDPAMVDPLAAALLAAGKTEEAVAAARRGLALSPPLATPALHVSLVRGLMTLGDVAEAASHVEGCRAAGIVLPPDLDAEIAAASQGK